MSWMDVFGLSIRNLVRRKGRTLLTVAGVVIGCCAVVIMVSMGIGMKKSQDETLQSMGNLMQVTVSTAPSSARNRTLLDKKAVKKFRSLENVEKVVAKKSLDLGELMVTAGDDSRFRASGVTIVSVPDEDLPAAGYVISKGKNLGNREGEVLAGSSLAYQFADSKRPESKNMVDYWTDENAKPFFDILKTALNVAQQKENTAADSSTENNANSKTASQWNILQKLTVVGVMKEDYDVGDETSTGILMRMRDFEKLEKLVKSTTNSKISAEYSSVTVTVTDISKVEEVEQKIKSMGFQTSSMESIRKPMEQSARQKQLMLGGLGAVSLFVAAIGIANTMIMSITERTREIGIMKSLGCALGDIRKEFLIEAALIGLVGGIVGSAVSCVVSKIMNSFSGMSLTDSSLDMLSDTASTAGTSLSVIPLWLIGFAILFSVLMGVAAGFFPADRAVHISALEAMKD